MSTCSSLPQLANIEVRSTGLAPVALMPTFQPPMASTLVMDEQPSNMDLKLVILETSQRAM